MFYAPFDGDNRAVLTTGTAKEVTPYTSTRGPFVPGVRKQARVLGGQNRCSFFVDDGFFPAHGTLSMWVRPEDWTPASRHFVFFARLSLTEVQREYVRVILYKYWDTNELALLAQNTVGEKKHSLIRTPIDSWQQGQWHHLAVTWDEQHFRLYVDGERKGEAAAVELPRRGRWEIAVGTPYPSWAYIGKERSAIDEVAVWPKAMAADEIKTMQESGAKPLSMRGPDEGPRKAVPQPVEGNLALESNGAFALASSFRNYESLYPDNLVDGNDATAWEPLDDLLPQWAEVRWEVAMKVNEVVLRQREAGSVSAFSVFGWSRERWQRLATVDAPAPERDLTAGFQEITTDRIRVVIDRAAARQWALTTLAVRGPDQPILRQLLDGKKDATAEKVMLTQVKIEPPEPYPGEELTVEIGLRAAEKLSGDFAFLLEIGDEPKEPGWSDFSIAKALTEPDTPTSQWPPGRDTILTFHVYLGKHAPDGLTSMRLRAFDRKRQANIDLVDDDGTSVDEVAKIHVRRFTEKMMPFPGGARARFDRGSAILEIGGRKTPPAAWAFTAPSFDRYHHYSRTGIHLYHVKTHPLSYDDTEEMLQRTCRHLDQRMGAVLRVDARATFLVHFDLRPCGDWLKRNPEERLRTAFGNLGPVSFSSAKYNEGVDRFLERLFAHLRGQPYYDHIIGYLPMACGAPDSVIGGVENNLFQKNRAKLTFGDHTPQAVREFQTWLGVRYGDSETKLREAWQVQDVSFDSARPKILDLVGEGVDGGVFRDPLGSTAPFDYAEWLSGVMGRFYSRLIDTIKRQAERPVIVGTYYGYNVAHLRGYNSPGTWLQNNNFDLRERIQDPDWDFFAAPTPYGNRRADLPQPDRSHALGRDGQDGGALRHLYAGGPVARVPPQKLQALRVPQHFLSPPGAPAGHRRPQMRRQDAPLLLRPRLRQPRDGPEGEQHRSDHRNRRFQEARQRADAVPGFRHGARDHPGTAKGCKLQVPAVRLRDLVRTPSPGAGPGVFHQGPGRDGAVHLSRRHGCRGRQGNAPLEVSLLGGSSHGLDALARTGTLRRRPSLLRPGPGDEGRQPAPDGSQRARRRPPI